MKKVQIKNLEQIAPGSYLLSFARDFDFLPGQVIGINLGQEQPERLYSIASGNRENDIRILFDIKDEGYLTPKLASLKAGDSITISPPFGNFICGEENAYWIASGTGIAPFLSMVFSGLGEGKTLIHGSRFLSHFYYRKELTVILSANYIPCSSAETAEGVFPGRLTSFLKAQEFLSRDKKYYLCGSAEMVVDTRDILIAKGIPYENIIAEIYF